MWLAPAFARPFCTLSTKLPDYNKALQGGIPLFPARLSVAEAILRDDWGL
jgi:hypothetical protein